MNADIIMIAMGVVILIINCSTMILTFPGKRSLTFTVSVLLLFTVAFYTFLYLIGAIVPDNGGLPGLLYLPVMILLFEGELFQKIFAYFLQFLLTAFQVTLAQTVSGIFAQYGDNVSFIVFLVLMLLMFTAYITLMFKFGIRFFKKLFEYGRSAEWAFYAFGALFSFGILIALQIAPGSVWHIVLVLAFILWSFGVLCFAIIITHEKAKHKYEAEFARDVISSGSEYYQKMSEMYDTLRVMRHDYKYHLDTINELLSSGDKSETEKYLADIKKTLVEKELPNFCSNSVINALLSSYSERCMELDIKFKVEISIPEIISVPNYEMCIVLGNLLENAVEASARQSGARKIELSINTQGAHLAVMVKNTFNGELIQDNDWTVSKKKDGGIGLRSVQAVVVCHGGELMTECDGTTFSAYVLMKL